VLQRPALNRICRAFPARPFSPLLRGQSSILCHSISMLLVSQRMH